MIRRSQFLKLLGAAAAPPALLTGCQSMARQGRDALGLGPKDEEIHRGLVFSQPGGQELSLDLYVPTAPRPAPLVVWFHGGAWKFGTKEFNFHLRDVTRHGFSVATVQYRKTGEAPWPAAVEDAEAGLAWLRLNASRYGVDATRVFLTGESAGGHLAAVLAARLGRSQIRGLFLMYAPTDLEALWKKYEGFSGTNQLFIELFGRDEEYGRKLARTASPVALARRSMPPTLMIHGDNDWIVPLAQSKALDARLRELGVESRLVVVKNQNHAFPLTSSQLGDVAAFFRSNL